MKRFLKAVSVVLAAVTAAACMSVSSFAYKLKTVDGIVYQYSNSGELKGKYSGWITSKKGVKYYYRDGVKVTDSWLKEKGKRVYYLDSKGRITTGDLELGGCLYWFSSAGRLVYGIQAKGSSTTQTGMKLSLNGMELGSDAVEVWTGEEYSIEQKNASGAWVKRSTVGSAGDITWNAIAYPFFSGGKIIQRSDVLDWENIYGKLPTGEYRLCKQYYVRLTPNAQTITKTLYVPFNIKVYEDAESAWGISMTVSDVTTDGLNLNISQPSTYNGYVEYYGSYILEEQDISGSWKVVDQKTLNDKRGELFSDLYQTLGDDDDLNGTAGGSHTDWIDYYCGELPEGHYRVKRRISGNCNGIKGSLYASAEFDILPTTPNSWGIYMEVADDACESSATLNITKSKVSNGNFVGDIWTSEAYSLEKYIDGEWEDVEMTDDNFMWSESDIEIKEGETEKTVLNWESVYGKLGKGTYRLGKTFYVTVNPQFPHTQEKNVFCTFTIDNGGVNIGKYDISVKVTKVSKNSVTFTVSRSGEYAGEIYWDGGYDIHRKVSSGKWSLYKGKSAMNTADAVSSDIVGNNSSISRTVRINSIYPALTSGTYRIKLRIKDQTERVRYFYGEFIIK